MAEALGVDLVNVLGARRPGSEPAVRGRNLEAADGGVVAGGAGELGEDRFASEFGGRDRLRSELLEDRMFRERLGELMRGSGVGNTSKQDNLTRSLVVA